jgi:hypothetical protein
MQFNPSKIEFFYREGVRFGRVHRHLQWNYPQASVFLHSLPQGSGYKITRQTCAMKTWEIQIWLQYDGTVRFFKRLYFPPVILKN